MKPFIYSLKVWLTSVLVGTLIFYFIGHPTDDSSMTFWGYMIVVCLYTLLCSSVSFFVFSAATAWLAAQQSATMDHDVHRRASDGSAFSRPLWQEPSGLVDDGGGGQLLCGTDCGRHLAV